MENKQKTEWLKTVEAVIANKIGDVDSATTGIPEFIEVSDDAQENRHFMVGFEISQDQKISIDNPTFVRARQVVEEVDSFLQQRDSFTLSLEALGVNPIAILPKKAWQKICSSCGLYCFESFLSNRKVKTDMTGLRNGMVETVLVYFFIISTAINFAFYNHWGIAAKKALFSSVASSVLIGFAISIVTQYIVVRKFRLIGSVDNEITLNIFTFITFAGLAFATFYPFYIIGLKGFVILAINVVFSIASYMSINNDECLLVSAVNVLPMSFIVKSLWPKRNDDLPDGSVYLTLHLPQTSEEFRNKLITLKPNSEKFCLAAERAAIRVSRSEIKGKKVEIMKYWKERDPIVYINSEDGKFVAVLAQFGNFKKEKKAIRKVESMKIEEMI